MKKIKVLAALICLIMSVTMQAQDKLFTLEDLNYGGSNYYSLQPKNIWTVWWGDELMYLDAEEGGKQGADGQRTTCFKLSDIGNGWHSAYSAEYPYPDQPLVLLNNSMYGPFRPD